MHVCRVIFSRSSNPLPASAFTSMSDWLSRKFLKILRNNLWSSAMAIRMGFMFASYRLEILPGKCILFIEFIVLKSIFKNLFLRI